MSKIFFVNSERRNWASRIRREILQEKPAPKVTRRYLLMVEDPKIAEKLKDGFSRAPHQCVPYDAPGNELMFYCITAKEVRRTPKFVQEIFFRLYKAGIPKEELDKIEIYEGKRSEKRFEEDD